VENFDTKLLQIKQAILKHFKGNAQANEDRNYLLSNSLLPYMTKGVPQSRKMIVHSKWQASIEKQQYKGQQQQQQNYDYEKNINYIHNLQIVLKSSYMSFCPQTQTMTKFYLYI
jgi:hypothetical protein